MRRCGERWLAERCVHKRARLVCWERKSKLDGRAGCFFSAKFAPDLSGAPCKNSKLVQMELRCSSLQVATLHTGARHMHSKSTQKHLISEVYSKYAPVSHQGVGTSASDLQHSNNWSHTGSRTSTPSPNTICPAGNGTHTRSVLEWAVSGAEA